MRFLIVVASLALLAGGSPAPAQTDTQSKSAPGASTSSISTPAQATASPNSAMADCMHLWDKGTHMTKEQWARTCKRIQTRLDNLKIENLDMKGLGIRRMPGTTPQGRVDSPSRPN
jgi:hypothetical protein